jgi:5-(carboxyamino)imidazole ribonucleotide mutase
MPQVAFFIGSISDKDRVRPGIDILKEFGVSYLFTVTSAHRTPERTKELVKSLEQQGCQVFICAAGMAAHLAGAVASLTIKPVLGVPVNASSLSGLDALLSTVQMPPGYPVGTLSLDSAGAKNAAWFALQILSLQDPDLARALHVARERMKQAVEEAAAQLKND